MKKTKKAGGWKSFFVLFKEPNKRHLYAFLFEFLFVLLMALGGLVFGRLQLLLQRNVQGISAEGIVAGLSTGASASTIASVKGTLILILVLVFLFLVYSLVCWTLTRALIWRALIHPPAPLSFFRFWLKLLPAGFVWTLITFVPLGLAFSYLVRVYESPLFPVVSRLSGYTYIFFIQLVAVILLTLYCHFTNLFYLHFFRTPKFLAVWDALKTGVVEFPRFAKPLGILLVFFVAVMLVGSLTSFLPEPHKTVGAFAFLFVFSTVSRVWYLTLTR